MPSQHVELPAHDLGRRPRVPLVAVLRGDPHRALLAAPAHEQLHVLASRVHGRIVDHVVGPLEREPRLREQSLHDLHGFLEPVEPLLHRRQLDAVGLMLVLLPAGAETEKHASAAHVVDGRDLVRKDRRMPVGVAEHERPDSHPLGRGRQSGHQRGALTGRPGVVAEVRHEVVGDVDAVPARALCPPHLVDDHVPGL